MASALVHPIKSNTYHSADVFEGVLADPVIIHNPDYTASAARFELPGVYHRSCRRRAVLRISAYSWTACHFLTPVTAPYCTPNVAHRQLGRDHGTS